MTEHMQHGRNASNRYHMLLLAQTIGTEWVSRTRPPALDSRKASNIQQGCQQEQQQHKTRTLATVGWTAAEAI
jgi:hypothetical protein